MTIHPTVTPTAGTSSKHWEAWFDGTAVPNPGRMGIGILLIAPDGEHREISTPLGKTGCNNEAELHALAATLELAQRLGTQQLYINSDSRFVVDCLTGLDSTEIEPLATLVAQIRQQMACFTAIVLRWLPRHRNTEADALARGALGMPPKPPPRH